MKKLETLFLAIARPLKEKGLGKIPGVRAAFLFLSRHGFVPSGVSTVRYDGLELDIDTRMYPEMLIEDRSGHLPIRNLAFKNMVKPGMNVVDVGASIGYYTLVAANLVGSTGRVYAFEPTPTTFELLKRNVERANFKNVTLVEKAVADFVGTTKLHLSKRNPLANSFGIGRTDSNFVEVEVTTLDAFFENTKVDVVKMNIEGAELLTLRGMKNLLERNPNLVMMVEFDPEATEGMGLSVTKYLEELLKNFDLQIALQRKDIVVPFESLKQIQHDLMTGATHLICTRRINGST